jgi:hypothetical protein
MLLALVDAHSVPFARGINVITPMGWITWLGATLRGVPGVVAAASGWLGSCRVHKRIVMSPPYVATSLEAWYQGSQPPDLILVDIHVRSMQNLCGEGSYGRRPLLEGIMKEPERILWGD